MKYKARGLQAEFIGHSQVLNGEVSLVYEALTGIGACMLLSPVYQEKLVAVVVDEAHTVKLWGGSITFAQIGELRRYGKNNG